MEKQKNLIMIHIESLSNVLYHQNRPIFKNIEKIINSCIVYNNFYSTGTSTLMVLADLFYGDMNKFEVSKSLSNLQSINEKKSLLQVLKDNGYKTHSIFFPEWASDDDTLSKIMGQVTYNKNFEEFKREINISMKEPVPFALFIYNGTSGISFLPLSEEKTWRTSWKEGYSNSDETIGYIFYLMKMYSLLENTVVIIYGDHGDDFWSHEFNNGFCHGIEPYANMVHTPLIIYNNLIGKQKLDDIVSIVDLNDLILSMLDLEEDTELWKILHDDGIDLSGGQKQKLTLARALYKDAPIVILDEPTAALDALAEYESYMNFDRLIGGKTAIYISHRLSSTKFCHAIAMFAHGEMIEYGTHEQLMEKNGAYKAMFDVQAQYYRERGDNNDQEN